MTILAMHLFGMKGKDNVAHVKFLFTYKVFGEVQGHIKKVDVATQV
jgi:hypothetical protein